MYDKVLHQKTNGKTVVCIPKDMTIKRTKSRLSYRTNYKNRNLVHAIFTHVASISIIQRNNMVWYLSKNGDLIWCKVVQVVYGTNKDMSDCDFQVESIKTQKVYDTIRSRLYKPVQEI